MAVTYGLGVLYLVVLAPENWTRRGRLLRSKLLRR